MSLMEALKEVTEAEEKALGVVKETPTATDEPPANDKGNDKAAGAADDAEPAAARDAGGKFKKTEDKAPKKDEAKKSAGAGEEPAAADDSPPGDTAAWAKLRRERAEAERQRQAAERRAEAAEARLKAAPTQPQPGPATVKEAATAARAEAEPDPNTDPEGHLRWQLGQTQTQLKEVLEWKAQQTHREQQVSLKDNAVKAFEGYEKAFAPTVEDYEPVMEFGLATLSASIRTLNPNLTGEALGEAIQRQVLRLAAQAEAKGEDPAESLYKLARSWGYKPKAADPAPKNDDEEPQKKPTIKDIGQHKRRSASSLAAGGKNGAAPLSREAVLSKDFGLQDFAKLSPSQLRELESLEG